MSVDAAPSPSARSDQRRFIWLAAVSLLGFGGLCLAWFLLPMDAWLQAFAAWADGLGAMGFVLMFIAYVIATILLVPGFPMTLAVAVAYGWWSFVICFFGGLLAAAISFLVARYWARDLVRRMIERRPVLKAVDSVAYEESFTTIMLARLTPITPFAMENYAFGVTGIRLMPFLAATALGIIPGTILNIWMGVLGRTAASGGASVANWTFLVVGFVATGVLSVWMTKKAKAKLAERETR